jgi:amino acid transporter
MEQPQGLRRELRFIEVIALSLAIMAPTAAMALNGTAVAGLIGRAVPLAFLIATIGVMFVSYGFVRLTRATSTRPAPCSRSPAPRSGRAPGSSPASR